MNKNTKKDLLTFESIVFIFNIFFSINIFLFDCTILGQETKNFSNATTIERQAGELKIPAHHVFIETTTVPFKIPLDLILNPEFIDSILYQHFSKSENVLTCDVYNPFGLSYPLNVSDMEQVYNFLKYKKLKINSIDLAEQLKMTSAELSIRPLEKYLDQFIKMKKLENFEKEIIRTYRELNLDKLRFTKNPKWKQYLFWLAIIQDDVNLLDAITEKYKDNPRTDLTSHIPDNLRIELGLHIKSQATRSTQPTNGMELTPLMLSKNLGKKNAEKWIMDFAESTGQRLAEVDNDGNTVLMVIDKDEREFSKTLNGSKYYKVRDPIFKVLGDAYEDDFQLIWGSFVRTSEGSEYLITDQREAEKYCQNLGINARLANIDELNRLAASMKDKQGHIKAQILPDIDMHWEWSGSLFDQDKAYYSSAKGVIGNIARDFNKGAFRCVVPVAP